MATQTAFKPKPEYEEDFGRVIRETVDEFYPRDFWTLKVGDISVYQNEIIHWPDKKKVDFILYCIYRQDAFSDTFNTPAYSYEGYPGYESCKGYVYQVCKTKMAVDETDFALLSEAFRTCKRWSTKYLWPLGPLIDQVYRQAKKEKLSDGMLQRLAELKAWLQAPNYYTEKDRLKMILKIDEMEFNNRNK